MDELNYIEIGKRIKIKRKELGITQEKLSELIDVCPSYISEIERGYSIPSLSTVCRISNVLDSSLDYIIFGITAKNADKTFVELLKGIPQKNHNLFIDLCMNISNSLK